MKFKSINNIYDLLSIHNKKLLILKANKQLELLIKSMPPDIKYKLTQKGVLCDIFMKNNRKFFRIRAFHNAFIQDIKNDSTKRMILDSIKFYKKLMPNDTLLKELDEKELIIQCNFALKAIIDYEKSYKSKIILKNPKALGEFNNLFTNEEQKAMIENIRKSIKKSNEQIYTLTNNS